MLGDLGGGGGLGFELERWSERRWRWGVGFG